MNRSIRVSMRGARVAAALFVVLVPLSACEESTSPIGEAHVIVNFTPAEGGSFTAKLNGKTFTSAGWFAVNLKSLESTYDITGSFTGGSLHVRFAASTAAGVQSGSVVSVEGPAVVATECGLTYVPNAPGSYQFRIQFKATGTIGLVCP